MFALHDNIFAAEFYESASVFVSIKWNGRLKYITSVLVLAILEIIYWKFTPR